MQPLTPALILLRGLPGSGKSSLALLLCENGKWPAVSIDDYFTDAAGNYEFRFDENHLAYKNCEERTQQLMHSRIEKIIVHNTFTLEWEMTPYFEMAKRHGYHVFVATVENHHGSGNIHHITDDQVSKMALKYRVKLY